MSRKVSVDLLSGGGSAIGCRICGGELLPALSAVKFGDNVPEGILFAGHSEGRKGSSSARPINCTFLQRSATLPNTTRLRGARPL